MSKIYFIAIAMCLFFIELVFTGCDDSSNYEDDEYVEDYDESNIEDEYDIIEDDDYESSDGNYGDNYGSSYGGGNYNGGYGGNYGGGYSDDSYDNSYDEEAERARYEQIYREHYSRLEEDVQRNIYDLNLVQDNYGAYTRMCSIIREEQQDMRRIRAEAEGRGIIIPVSPVENLNY